jgi:hypothetical protein
MEFVDLLNNGFRGHVRRPSLEKVLDQIMDVVDNILEDFPCDTLKSRLLETHTLSDHEKLIVLYQSEPLGGRKPSQMLATMLTCCPTGINQTIMIQYMFLQRLPVTLTFFRDQEPGDIRSLAARADRLWATHKPQSHDLVAHLDTAEEQLAQITAVQKKEPFKKKKFARKKSGGGQLAAGGSQAVATFGSGGSGSGGSTHSKQALVGSGLCYFH